MAIFDRPTKWNGSDYEEEARVPFFTADRKKQMIYNGEEFFISQCFKTVKPDAKGKLKWIIQCEMCMSAEGQEDRGMLSFEAGNWRDEEMSELAEYLKANKGQMEGPVYLREKPTRGGYKVILITASQFKDTNAHLTGVDLENVPF